MLALPSPRATGGRSASQSEAQNESTTKEAKDAGKRRRSGQRQQRTLSVRRGFGRVRSGLEALCWGTATAAGRTAQREVSGRISNTARCRIGCAGSAQYGRKSSGVVVESP